MKSILVVDTPKNCSECEFYIGFDDDGYGVCHNGSFDINCNKAKEQRHPQCPLQDTTDLLEALEELKLEYEGDLRGFLDFEEAKRLYNKLYKALGGK